jgi:GH25 family lysozyme M1 (1,4-beta-N-acetylmuramidase)
LGFVCAAYAAVGVDVSQAVSTGAFQCLRNAGYGSFAIPRVYQSVGRPDPNGASNVKNAWASGMPHVDGYIFPCPTCGNGYGQVAAAVSALRNGGATIGMLWLDIEGTQYWMDQASNRNFFNSLVSGCQAAGVHCGVYTSASQWNPIMGSFSGGSNMPLWYAHYDGNPSFSDFSGFGGWSKPAMKQYRGDVSACGVGIDLTWYPG